MSTRPTPPGFDDEAIDTASAYAAEEAINPRIAANRAKIRAIAASFDERQAEMERALAHYDNRLRPHLLAQHLGMYATIDADTGDYVVASSGMAASRLFRETYGQDRPGWTLHIGTT